MGIPGRRRQATGAGFTLVELVLTVALLLLLVGAAVFNFNSAQRGAQLEEGAGQVESLFRYARAQAASTGRRVLVSFVGEAALGSTNGPASLPGIQVLWEPDPLGEPGKFIPLAEATPFTDRLNELVQFRPVLQLETGSSGTNNAVEATASATAEVSAGTGGAAESAPPGPPPILFYPDGSSDSTELILVALDAEDTRRLHLSLAGLTGTVRRKWLTPEGEAELPSDSAEAELGGDTSSTTTRTPTP